jgi:hypothetical protein
MRISTYVGVLVLGLSLGVLMGLYFRESDSSHPTDPLVDDYVRLVSVLYAKGESLPTVEARLNRLGTANTTALVRGVVSRSLTSPDATARASAGDIASLLETLAPQGDPVALAPQRMAASGRGSESPVAVQGAATQEPSPVADPTPTPEPTPTATVTPTPLPEEATLARDAFLRARPSVEAPILGVIPKGTRVHILETERGQMVEGNEDRWQIVERDGEKGYVYYTMLDYER